MYQVVMWSTVAGKCGHQKPYWPGAMMYMYLHNFQAYICVCRYRSMSVLILIGQV